MLHFWEITIDTISCINIVLAVGLCVDYSAHIAHAFIVAQGKVCVCVYNRTHTQRAITRVAKSDVIYFCFSSSSSPFLLHFSPGTSVQRAQHSLTTMGPAIMNGGITTFLALVLLGFSESYAFIVFFKVSPLFLLLYLRAE